MGTQFALWVGDIHGTNTEVVKGKMLVQDCYGGDWTEPSRVTFTLEPEEGGTKVILVHDNIPDAETDAIRDGWRRFYLGPMKGYLEAS